MKRRDFIQKTGLLGLGVGTLALIRPTNVEGGVSDNATLERIVGHSEIANFLKIKNKQLGKLHKKVLHFSQANGIF